MNIDLNLDSAQSLENIRVLINQETKEIWFVAKDIADILGIKNSRQALSDLDEDEKIVSF